MATFTCSECNFSKPVADEMAGKKARCPKCNAVNDIPLNDEVLTAENDSTEQEATSDNESATNADNAPSEPANQAAASPRPATDSVSNGDATTSQNPFADVPKGWLMALGGCVVLICLAALLFAFNFIDFGIICFAIGILGFAAMSAMYSFRS